MIYFSLNYVVLCTRPSRPRPQLYDMDGRYHSLNRKMRPRYLGPLIVISRNRGGAYILAELDGTLFDRPTAAFRVIPYFARKKIDLPPLEELLDVSNERLQELRNSTVSDPEGELDDAVNDTNNIEEG
jgi:hypothetical protein